LEKVIYSQLITFLNENKVIAENQSGFRPNRSTETTLLHSFKNSLIIQEQNTKKNHKRVVVLYVIKNHVNLHKL
jgi:hypothetical protein